MDFNTSDYVKNIEISGIRKFFNKVVDYPNAISLTLGQPDFPMPEKIKAAAVKAINENKTVYTPNAGIFELRKEICEYLKKQDINYKPEDVCVTVGGSEGLLSVFMALLNPGDTVLIPTPAYPAYESCVKLVGGQVENYWLNKEFNIDICSLEEKIKALKPKVLVLSFPSNPTGAVLSKENRDSLHKIIKENNIIVITDEIYSSLCFEAEYYSVAQFDDIKNNIVLVSGFSKMFSMTGMRIGYVCAKEQIMKEVMKVHQYNVSCAPSIAQYGVLEGLRSCLTDVENMKKEFIKRRNFMYEGLVSLGFEVINPRGAFYIFPSIKKFNLTSEEFCDRLLKEAGVAMVPGSAFGIGGEGYARISYSYSLKELEAALERIKNWKDSL